MKKKKEKRLQYDQGCLIAIVGIHTILLGFRGFAENPWDWEEEGEDFFCF